MPVTERMKAVVPFANGCLPAFGRLQKPKEEGVHPGTDIEDCTYGMRPISNQSPDCAYFHTRCYISISPHRGMWRIGCFANLNQCDAFLFNPVYIKIVSGVVQTLLTVISGGLAGALRSFCPPPILIKTTSNSACPLTVSRLSAPGGARSQGRS